MNFRSTYPNAEHAKAPRPQDMIRQKIIPVGVFVYDMANMQIAWQVKAEQLNNFLVYNEK